MFGSTCTPVAKDFWEAWKKKVGAGYAPLKNGMLWAVESTKKADGNARAKDMESTKTGFEQLDPKVEMKDKSGRVVGGPLDDRDAPEE